MSYDDRLSHSAVFNDRRVEGHAPSGGIPAMERVAALKWILLEWAIHFDSLRWS